MVRASGAQIYSSERADELYTVRAYGYRYSRFKIQDSRQSNSGFKIQDSGIKAKQFQIPD